MTTYEDFTEKYKEFVHEDWFWTNLDSHATDLLLTIVEALTYRFIKFDNNQL